MKRRRIFTLALIFLIGATNLIIAQKKWKTIKATSTQVDIRDGEKFYKASWTISPDIKPDVYSTNNKNEKVTFYTDLDSISFIVDPNKTYDFYILLNEKDTAWTQIKYEPSYLDKLKAAAEYNTQDNFTLAPFTYQDSSNVNLKEIRVKYNLDSVAGEGNEVSKMINLMHWVHNVVRHDGGSYNPEKKNTIAMIELCQKEGRGINCRMMASMLNECYLAMGFKSRFVTCMPKELEFDDCHVINMVYSNELEKWLWMDPTFDTYVMDQNGVLLGLEEVREKLINDEPLIINPAANWNYKSSTTKEYYLDFYMAKNLYRFSCLSDSKFNSETKEMGKEVSYIELLPLDGLAQAPKFEEKEIKSTNGKRFEYKTNNPNLFWAKP